tara:strand:- start:1236 stop:2048 length:813 start_codon:yes stop_codon:yes gene_type:complete
MVKKHLYIVTGGLGKNVAFTSILKDLYEKHKSKICIEATFPIVFYNNPYVASSNPLQCSPVSRIGQRDHYAQYETINGNEPYYSNWLKKDKHLITSFQELNNLPVQESLPEIYWRADLESKLQDVISKITPFIIVQFSGGPSNQEYNFGLLRDYKQGQNLINSIKQFRPDLNILVFGSDNLNYEQTLKMDFKLTEQYFILSKYCMSFIGIDSALQHFASNHLINKRGLVLWGETSPQQFGYNKNINMLSETPHTVDINVNNILENFKQLI